MKTTQFQNLKTRLQLMKNSLTELSAKELDGDSMAIEILKILDNDDHAANLLEAA